MSRERVAIDAQTTAEIEAIDAAREEAFIALRMANRRGITGSDAAAVLEAFRAVDERCAALQRRVWPRYRGRLVVALGVACLVSPTGRRGRLLWEREA